MNWFYENTKNKDVVISSRVRLARNLTNYPFSQKLTQAEADKLINEVIKTIPLLEKRLSKNISGYTLSSIKENEKNAIGTSCSKSTTYSKEAKRRILLSEDENKHND